MYNLTFPPEFPVAGGKAITLRPPTAGEELELFAAQGAAATETDLAKRCIVEFDGAAVKDVERDQVWDHELDGRARRWVRQWVGHCLGVGDSDPPFLATRPG